ILFYVAMAAIGVLVIHTSMQHQESKQRLDFGQFMREVEKGNVRSLTIHPKNTGEGRFVAEAPDGTIETKKYVVNLPPDPEIYYERVLAKVDGPVEQKQPSIPDVLVSGLFYLLVTGLLI
ncbi:MAG: hypothetical protein GTN78_16145, partial [Gemmatimonadales bacterium]|nr:hypothetical protein [Gemmatimonadales bacterium]